MKNIFNLLDFFYANKYNYRVGEIVRTVEVVGENENGMEFIII